MKHMLVMLLVIATLFTGCVSSQRAQEMTNLDLAAYAYRQATTGFKPDKNVAREIHSRGGMSDAELTAIEEGEHWVSATKLYSARGCPCVVDVEAMGIGAEWELYYSGLPTRGSGTTIYTRRGSVTVRHLGGGTFIAR